MNAKDITNWTDEHEKAKRYFIKRYIFNELAPLKPSTGRLYLGEMLWQKALDEGNLIFERTKGKLWIRYKDSRMKDWEQN